MLIGDFITVIYITSLTLGNGEMINVAQFLHPWGAVIDLECFVAEEVDDAKLLLHELQAVRLVPALQNKRTAISCHTSFWATQLKID